jgi:hypothetical protein
VDFEFAVEVSGLVAATVFAERHYSALVIFNVVADFMAYTTHICIEGVRVIKVVVFLFHFAPLEISPVTTVL